ncbi:hypothetical protein DM02DRAFT_670026 [Periconia macrospinosa]|uniref:Uncharacterized protein n=1 Tax=Periconia macrospinosa TaxID=97972 RepID=A0A2V1DYY1_9PLEO|nr:hypothetical protein DM02DRAFT_670026 [Periconia macrospinosa]
MNVQLSFDLGQVLGKSQNVPALSTVADISANLGVKNSSASPSPDPAQTGSVNAYFGHPKHSVFMIYQAGTEQGSNQNYACFAIASQVPFNLTQLQASLELNKTANAGVVVAVESSTRDDFTSYQTAGTLSPTPVSSSKTVPLALYVPAGLTYLRLRAASTVGGDNTSGLAYSNLVLLGSLVPAMGSVLTSPAPIDPQTTQTPSTPDTFIISYDLGHTADFAQRVGVIGVATNGVTSILGTNAPTPTDGEVERHAPFSSVGLSDDGQKAFRLFNFGTQQGANQNYLWALISNKLPLIIQAITFSFNPSVAGSSAISLAATTASSESATTIISPNTLALAVEASVTADFQNPVTLGSVPISIGSGPTSTAIVTTALLPRGFSFIRFRATTPTPMGNATDNIAFTNISIKCAPVQDSWQQIGAGPVRSVLTYSNMLFSVSDTDGSIWQYLGDPNSWTRIGDAADQFVGCEGGLYSLTCNLGAAGASSAIKQWNQLDGQWDDIGPTTPGLKLKYLLTGFKTLFGVDTTNTLWTGASPTTWVRLGGPFSNVVATDQYCFAIPFNGQVVQKLPVEGSTQWTNIGGPTGMSSLFAAGNALYTLNGTGALFRWSGQGTYWTLIDQGPFQRLALGGDSVDLLGITGDGLAVLLLAAANGDGSGPLRWDFVGQNMTGLCANRLWLAGVREDGRVFLYFWQQQSSGADPTVASITSDRIEALRLPFTFPGPPQISDNWVWQYHTADSLFAGYDGSVQATLKAGGESVSVALPAKHYERNEMSTIGLQIPYLPDGDVMPLASLELIALNSFNPFYTDHWTVDWIEMWDLRSNVKYFFQLGADVPVVEPGGGPVNPLFASPTMTTRVDRPPSYARVLIWSYLGLDVAVGHASITIPDPEGGPDIYISWWPGSEGRTNLPFLPLTFSAPANNDQTWNDDRYLEGTEPEFVLPVFGIDGTAVKNWWKGFNVPGAKWNAYSTNCSTVVYLALLNGGVIPNSWKPRLAIPTPWTPTTVMKLVMALVTKDYPIWVNKDKFD